MLRRLRARKGTVPVLAAGVLAAAVAGCASEEDPGAFPPPATPAAAAPAPGTAGERPAGRVVEIGGTPTAIVADGPTGLAAVATGAQLVVVDVRTLEVRRRVRVPAPVRDLAPAQDDGAVLATAGDQLLEIELRTGRVETRLQAPFPLDAVAAGAEQAWTTRAGGARLVAEAGFVAPTAAEPTDLVAVDDGVLAVVGGRSRTLALHDPRTGERYEELPVGAGPTRAAAGDDGRLYVTDTAGGAVLYVATMVASGEEERIVRRTALPGRPFATTTDRERGKLWVTQTALNRVTQLTADGQPRPQRSYATVPAPEAIAIHEPTATVLVASRTEGTLQAFPGYPPS